MLSKEQNFEIKKAIRKNKTKRVLIQIPEGLKTKAQEISKEIENFGVEVVILADPCYGACDIPDYQASLLECDLIIHFGHSSFGLKSKIPIIYIPYESDMDVLRILEKDDIKHKKIGIVTTIQHLHKLNEIKDFLEKQGKEVFIGGQILGCKLENVKKIENNVDCILYIGSGKFHALGILKTTEKPVLHLDIENRKIIGLSKERREMTKRKLLKESKLDYAKKVGILVSTKKGQLNKNVFNLKKKLENEGKEVWILAMDYISPEKILGMKFDVLVNTACPRIEDDLVFKETVINKTI